MSKIEYICEVMNKSDDLYKLCLKLFETDAKEMYNEMIKIATN